ncbi:MAG: hypothetical protein WCJ04_14430 [Actinomycetes bacterium]
MSTAAPESSSWACDSLSGRAQELHDAVLPPHQRAVRLNSVVRPAIVLGSAQSAETLLGSSGPSRDAAIKVLEELGVDLVTRRSGGGAVWLSPNAQCWLDIWLPAGDPLWHSDVGRSSWWLGECWAQALAGVAQNAPVVHRGPLIDRALGQVACFAGLGPGEVAIDNRKVVGISQRRSRLGAKFQCVVYTQWNPEPLLSILRLGEVSDEMLAELEAVLSDGVQEVRVLANETGISAEEQLLKSLIAQLPG